jgi:hypothetical protein
MLLIYSVNPLGETKVLVPREKPIQTLQSEINDAWHPGTGRFGWFNPLSVQI